jgi:hypothetical protein
MPSKANDTLEGYLEQIQIHGLNLTTWEEDFVESVAAQVKAGHPVSERQAEIIERIYAERTP